MVPFLCGLKNNHNYLFRKWEFLSIYKTIHQFNGNTQTDTFIFTYSVFLQEIRLKPQKNHHTIKTFIEAVDNGVEEILAHKQTLPRNNISKAEKTIINEFLKRDDLVSTKADKGGATLIIDVDNCIEK